MQEKNLTPEKWKQAIIGGQTPQLVAGRIRNGPPPPWFDPILQEARNARGLNVSVGGSVLELGSGTGELSLALMMACGFHVTLVDFSSESLDFSSQVYNLLGAPGMATFRQADVTERLPFDDNAFDVVFSSGLLEHFEPHMQVFIFSEAFRVTRDIVITLVPNAASLPYRLGKFLQERSGNWRWGKEDPVHTFDSVYHSLDITEYSEWSVGHRHALNFMRGAGINHAADLVESLYDHMEKAGESVEDMNQGYLLVSVGYKKGFFGQ